MKHGTCTQRLLADYREIQENPLELVSAAPVGDDLRVWHANLLAMEACAYSGAVFHIELTFPEQYPAESPSVRVLTPIPHPHVHGDRVCLDLLSDFNGFFRRAQQLGDDYLITGWSPAYSVLSVLVQLQAFLLELAESDSEDSDSLDSSDVTATRRPPLEQFLIAIPQAVRASRVFKCSKCPHEAPVNIWPPLVSSEVVNSRKQLAVSSERDPAAELVCFHSRRSWRDDILGYGINVVRKRHNFIAEVSATMDLVSWTSYSKHGVRRGVLSGEETAHWIPLFINAEHGARALPLFKRVVTELYQSENFHPEMAFDLLSKLMSFFVVLLMSGDIHVSEHSLKGYCHFHRWLLEMARLYPSVLAVKEKMVGDFIAYPARRLKTAVPNLAEFLTSISLPMRYEWKDVQEAYFQETTDRNALWIIRRYSRLAKVEPDATLDARRPEQSFECCSVSLRLLLFHVYFLQHIARPSGVSGEEVARRYDERYGSPSESMRDEWREKCAEIFQVSSWDQFFEAFGEQPRERDKLNAWLREAVANSLAKGYHSLSAKARSRMKGKRGGKK